MIPQVAKSFSGNILAWYTMSVKHECAAILFHGMKGFGHVVLGTPGLA